MYWFDHELLRIEARKATNEQLFGQNLDISQINEYRLFYYLSKEGQVAIQDKPYEFMCDLFHELIGELKEQKQIMREQWNQEVYPIFHELYRELGEYLEEHGYEVRIPNEKQPEKSPAILSKPVTNFTFEFEWDFITSIEQYQEVDLHQFCPLLIVEKGEDGQVFHMTDEQEIKNRISELYRKGNKRKSNELFKKSKEIKKIWSEWIKRNEKKHWKTHYGEESVLLDGKDIRPKFWIEVEGIRELGEVSKMYVDQSEVRMVLSFQETQREIEFTIGNVLYSAHYKT